MGDTKPSDNTLHKTRHNRSSMLSYRVGLDQHTILQVRLKGPTTSLARSHLTTQHITKRNLPMKLQSEILRQHLRLETSLKADQSHLHWSCYSLGFMHVHDAKVIKQHFLLQLTVNSTATLSIKKKVRLFPASVNH